ncbi:MAG: non-canonical purine NTP pyrophosphatase [Thermoplasmata archaeon]|nr:non-canonical purine NTP pyrophosphatase [Thermoplasmata archaeon]
MDVTFVTSNPGKLAEVRRIFRPYGIQVGWSQQELPEPQAERLEDVVRAKLAAAARAGSGVVVEDSGMFVRALGGFPGVYSRYVLDTIGLDGVLRLAHGRSRAVQFRAVAGYRRGRTELYATGTVQGTLATRPRGANGLGYDPIFVPTGERRTFAQMDPAAKDARSHRGRAMRSLARKIRALEGT